MTTLLTELETLRRKAEGEAKKHRSNSFCGAAAVADAEGRAYAHAAKLAIQYNGMDVKGVLRRLEDRHASHIATASTAERYGHPQEANNFRMRADGILTAMIIVKGEDKPVDEDEPRPPVEDVAKEIANMISVMITATELGQRDTYLPAKEKLTKLLGELLS